MGCGRCDQLPETNFSNVDVWVSLSTIQHAISFERSMKEYNVKYIEQESGYLIININLESLVQKLCCNNFNNIEKKDVRVLPVPSGEEFSFKTLKHYRNLAEWEALFHGKEVTYIIENKSIKTMFQPIVSAITGEIYGFEALSRGIKQDGSLMNPEILFRKAKEMDLLFYLDRICRECSIRSAAKLMLEHKIFINFIPTAIYEPELCLQSTEAVLHEVGIRPEQVVFEVVETERIEDYIHLNHILDYYREKGYSTALDDIGSGYSDIPALLRLRPDYMKIDMELIKNIHIDNKKQEEVSEFIRQGKELGVKILAEGVERVKEFEFLKSMGVDLVQGYLFGKPSDEINL